MRISLSAGFIFTLATFASAAEPRLIPPAVNSAQPHYVVETRIVETAADGQKTVHAEPTIATVPGHPAEIQVAGEDGKFWTLQLEVNDGQPQPVLQVSKAPAPCEGPDCLGVPLPFEELPPPEPQSFHQLVQRFNQLIDQRRFVEAAQTAKRAAELQPHSPVTTTMAWKADFALRLLEHQAQACNEFHCGAPVPEHDMAESIQLASRTVLSPAKHDWQAAAEQALDRPVSMYFKNVPLKEVVEFLSSRSGANFVIDSRGLEAEGVQPDAPVTILVEDIKLRSVLKLVLEPLNLTFKLEDEVIKITSPMRSDLQVVKMYRVADLLKGKDADAAATCLEGLCDLITATIAPDSWNEVGGPCTVRGSAATESLVVRQTQQGHEQIAELFEQLRRLSFREKDLH